MERLPASTACDLSELAALSREELVSRLMTFRGKFPFDFTESFLAQKTTDQLRHILMAACKYAAESRPGPSRQQTLAS